MKTKQKTLDINNLEKWLNKNLSHPSLGLFSLIINCFKEGEKINILLQHSPPVIVNPDPIFTHLKTLLKKQSFAQMYHFRFSLAIYGQPPYAVDNLIIHAPDIRKKNSKIIVKNKYIWLLFAASLISSISVYYLTKPCVIGECKVILQAEELALQSEKLLQEKDLIEAHLKLTISLEKLASIPSFSSSYNQAQNLSKNYQNILKDLTPILTITQEGNQLLIEAQKNTENIEEFVKIRENFAQQITKLKQIPPESQFYDIGRETLIIYEQELKQIDSIYQQQKQAENDLIAATEIAKINEIRQKEAFNLEEWQLVNTTWTLVKNRLTKINSQNINYQKSQELLTKYAPKIKIATEKLKEEQNAQKTYQEAIKTAQNALNFEQQNQYSLAVKNWQAALKLLSSINQNTSQFSEAQKLINTYQNGLNQAQNGLKLAQTRQKAIPDLNKICSNQEKICNFNIKEDNIIRVYLNPQYMQKILQIAMSNQLQGDLTQHITSVQNALESVSNKHKLPLEVYHPDGALLFTYSPL